MNCFPCCGHQKDSHSKREHGSTSPQETIATKPDMKKQREEDQYQGDPGNIQAQYFTFRELATATKNFRQECLLSEGGFGRVYKGVIPATGQVVAVKQLDRHGTENSREFLAEVASLSLLHHENLVDLIGYCADGDQRLLVYEYFPGYTLEVRLFDNNKTDQPALNWFDRMKVAAGASKGLEYLHNSANPPVIYRDLKTFNILLNNDVHARLYDFGMARLSGSDKMNSAPPRVMGTYGYCAPECVRTGTFTLKSDVYSFGVVLLELITGRRVIDTTRPNEEQNLVSWAQPLFRDPKRYPDMADPVLNKQFPEKDLNQAVAIAAMCLQEEAEARPLIGDVVTALSFLSMETASIPPSLPPADSISKESYESQSESERDLTESEYESGSEYDRSKSIRSKTSRKSSTRKRNGTVSSDSGDGTSISNYSRSRSSGKWNGTVDNINHKSLDRELSKKKSSVSHKSSGKSYGRMLSSMRSNNGSISSRGSGDCSSRYSSSVMTQSDFYSKRTEESMRLDMMESDEGSARPFDLMSSSGSER